MPNYFQIFLFDTCTIETSELPTRSIMFHGRYKGKVLTNT